MTRDDHLEHARARFRALVERKLDEGVPPQIVIIAMVATAFHLGSEAGLSDAEIRAILERPEDYRLH